jgi:hypothetical protein
LKPTFGTLDHTPSTSASCGPIAPDHAEVRAFGQGEDRMVTRQAVCDAEGKAGDLEHGGPLADEETICNYSRKDH